MKPQGKSNSVSKHSEYATRILRCIGIAGAVILLNGCASVGSSADADTWQYNPNTGYPAVGSRPWLLN